MNMVNHQFRLAARPFGLPKPGDWNFSSEPVAEPQEGQVLIQILYISLDPAMRGWMNDAKSYIEPVKLGDVMRAGGLGRVLSSKNPNFAAGEYVTGMFGVQEYAISEGRGLIRVDANAAPLPLYLSTLGMTGMTAYFGLLEVGRPKPGDTVVVSGAAGAVGAVVGQIAKIKGCRAVGIAGGPEKCAYLTRELGFDAAIDYKNQDLRVALTRNCPAGIDVYFDNVGGTTLDSVLTRISRGARIVICGAISQYNNTTPVQGPSNYLSLLVNRARMEGMLVFDYASRYAEAAREMAAWIAEGKLVSREHVVEGLEAFPDALLKLFRGENLGKLMLKVRMNP